MLLNWQLWFITEPPNAPTNLHASSVTTSSATLAWDQPSKEAGSDVGQYYIEMNEPPKADYVLIGKIDGRVNSYTVEFLQKGRLYRFRVKAKNAAGFSEAAELENPIEVKEIIGRFQSLNY